MKFVAYIVHPDPTSPLGERVELIDMRGRVLKDRRDAFKWLGTEAPKRADLAGRRIDIVDVDEPLDAN